MARNTHAPKTSAAAQITAAILHRLEAGTKPWVQPWRGTPVRRPLRACGTPYRGVNTFWLWLVADTCGYQSAHWMTYRQCETLGGQVRRGERASIAVFYKSYARGDDEEDRTARRVLKSYPVFNADQCDGLPERFRAAESFTDVDPLGRRDAFDTFFERIPAVVRHHGCEAYFEPAFDRITLPPANLFQDFDHYYATRAHELAHWTGHRSRLARDLAGRFGSRAYAAEELVAELASAIVGAELGLPVAHLDSHASYIADWIDLLRHDERALLTAAARAEEAAKLILELGGWTAPAGDADEDQLAIAA